MASCLIETEEIFSLEAYGADKAEAFGKAFAALKNKAYASLSGKGLLIYMEPIGVEITKEHWQDTREKIVSFFKPKPTMHYQVELQVTVKMRYVPLDTPTEPASAEWKSEQG